MQLDYSGMVAWLESLPGNTPMTDYTRLWSHDNPLARYLAAHTDIRQWGFLATTYEGGGKTYALPRWAQLVLECAEFHTPWRRLTVHDVLDLLCAERIRTLA